MTDLSELSKYTFIKKPSTMRGTNNWRILICLIIIGQVLLTSCVQRKSLVYFSNITSNDSLISASGLEPVIQTNDMLSINVSSLSSDAVQAFNAPNFPTSVAANPGTALQQTAGYLVDQQGTIQFPQLGKIKVAGLTKSQLEELITQRIVEKEQLIDPIVKIRYLNFRVTVLGEVARPGVITVPSEQISILEAIGAAGDLTIYGKRDNIVLIRQEGGQKKVYRINMNNIAMVQSPYYYLRSNDVLYVEPVKARAAAASRGQQLLPSILSGVSIVAVIVSALIR